jgi:hypothetical protein
VKEARGDTLNARGRAATAYRVHVGRLVAGHNEEMSVDAEAGELLEAEFAANVHGIAAFLSKLGS